MEPCTHGWIGQCEICELIAKLKRAEERAVVICERLYGAANGGE